MTTSKNTNGFQNPHRTPAEIREQLIDLNNLKAHATAYGTPDFASQLGMQSILAQERELKEELRVAILRESPSISAEPIAAQDQPSE